jgi:serine/threonine protein phosphatase PrpC
VLRAACTWCRVPPDAYVVPRGRVLILATDGLWDVLNDGQAVKIACDAARRVHASAPAANQTPAHPNKPAAELAAEAGAAALVKRATELGSLDNVTVLVAWIEWDDAPPNASPAAAPTTPALA